MRSGWFFGTDEWATYQRHYWQDRERPQTWKSSPLDNDHDFSDMPKEAYMEDRLSQVIDLSPSLPMLWRDVRKSYRPLINKVLRSYTFDDCQSWTIMDFHRLHTQAHGRETRSQRTWDCMTDWMQTGNGLLIMARQNGAYVDGAYFILHKNGAYYASAASLEESRQGVHHAVIWEGIKALKRKGVRFLELGDVTPGETEKEQGIRFFKTGFGGEAKPYQVVK